MLNKYFAPYAEYILRTKLSEAELRTALQRECGCTFANWKKFFLAGWRASDTIPFYMRKCRAEIVLTPNCRGRNSARGEIHLTLKKACNSSDTLLHIIIRPQDMRWFCVLWLGGLTAWTVGILCSRKWMMLFPIPIMLGGFFLILQICRSAGEQEIPLIQHSFEALIRKLENDLGE